MLYLVYWKLKPLNCCVNFIPGAIQMHQNHIEKSCDLDVAMMCARLINSIHIALSLKAQATLHFTRTTTTTPGARDRKIVYFIIYTVLMSYFIIFAFHFSHFTPFLYLHPIDDYLCCVPTPISPSPNGISLVE